MHKSTELRTVDSGSSSSSGPQHTETLLVQHSAHLGCLSIGNNLWGKLHADAQQMSSSATPCSRMSFVTVFPGLLHLQEGMVKENLKKKVEELRCRRKLQSFVTSFCPSKKEEQDSQAHKMLKKPQQTQQNKMSRHCGSVESMVGKILLTER